MSFAKVGGEFLVNTITAGIQSDSNVTTLPDGRFVVTWTNESQSGGDTSGDAESTSEFLVNSTTNFSQFDPTVTALADGRFVITWTDNSQSGGDTSSTAIRGRIFNANSEQTIVEKQ